MRIYRITHEDELIESVIDLGNKNAKTLGFFPEGAFREHARKKYIVVAVKENKLVGYLLFRITQKTRVVSITHLCVADAYRNNGIAKKLLDFLKDEYQQLFRGFQLNCRKDYKSASKFWEKYGFKAVSEKRSRSKEEKYLIKWWYDFGNDDLFSFSYSSSPKIKALLDASILIKLRDQEKNERKEIGALYADWLVDEVEFYYAPEIYNEIKRDKDKSRIGKTRSFIRSFEEARFKPEKRDKILFEIKEFLLGNSVNDKSDRKQVSECIAADINYFITTDENILRAKDEIFESYSLNILRPSDFILFIDEHINGMNYQSYRVAGANYDYRRINPQELDDLVEKFLQYSKGERKHVFRDKLTKMASEPNKTNFKLIKSNRGNCIGFYTSAKEGKKIIVESIRCGGNSISEILFQQVLYDIIKQAVSENFKLIKICEAYLTEEEKAILASFGFQKESETWIRLVFSGIESANSLFTKTFIQQYWNVDDLKKKLGLLSEDESEKLKLSIEKNLWPLKLKDCEIPIYIIPIKPYWAAHLFDYYLSQFNIFGSNPKLSWSRENIYYRSVNPVSEQAPARILWYLSTNTSNKYSERQKGISACSYLEEVYIDTAKQLYGRFKNYGIYSWSNICRMTKNNPQKLIKAIRFSDTEVFDKIVKLEEIHRIFNDHNKPKNTFVSPVKVSNDIFQELYKKGINIDE